MFTYLRPVRVANSAPRVLLPVPGVPINNNVHIYNTKIDEFVCPKNISQTVAVRIMKLAHRPRIASTTIKLISNPILLSILAILLKAILRIGTEYPKHRPDKHVRKGQGAAFRQINLYYIIFSTIPYSPVAQRLERATDNRVLTEHDQLPVRIPLRPIGNFCNSFTPLCQCFFRRDTNSRWSLLAICFINRGSLTICHKLEAGGHPWSPRD